MILLNEELDRIKELFFINEWGNRNTDEYHFSGYRHIWSKDKFGKHCKICGSRINNDVKMYFRTSSFRYVNANGDAVAEMPPCEPIVAQIRGFKAEIQIPEPQEFPVTNSTKTKFPDAKKVAREKLKKAKWREKQNTLPPEQRTRYKAYKPKGKTMVSKSENVDVERIKQLFKSNQKS